MYLRSLTHMKINYVASSNKTGTLFFSKNRKWLRKLKKLENIVFFMKISCQKEKSVLF